jgi:hypothetical protein
MPLYEVTDLGLRRHDAGAFKDLGLYETADLQRLLRDDISVLADDLRVVAEEFGEWEDARRRIDLLALDKSGRLVVIELKRTDDGGHMELQALRYGAMVSSMGFAEVVAAYAAHCAKHRPSEEVDARGELLSFLDADDAEDEDPVISSDVRLMLVSADFGREITTTVLWLNRFDGMDIRCVRLVPYYIEGRVLLDIQQVLPLPEAADYQVRLRRKDAHRERVVRGDGRDFTRYHVVVDGDVLPDENKRHTVRVMVEQLVARGVAPDAIAQVLPASRWRVVDGEYREPAGVSTAIQARYPTIETRRHFIEHPLVHEGRTWILSKQWGRKTEPTLEALAAAFPEAKVSFRRADEG